MTKLVLGSVVMFCVLVLPASTQLGAQDKKDDVLKVDARTLLSDYTKDRKAADLKYKGKVLEVEGVVKGTTGLNKAVSLEGGTDTKLAVQCNFGSDTSKAIGDHHVAARLANSKAGVKKESEKVKEITRGISVVIRGTCNSVSGTSRKVVVLDNCEVIDPILLKK
jgi:hypothetical protein